jgi:DNA-binding transcriptional LysR family regulator
VRVDVEDAEVAAVGEVVRGWVDADRAAMGAECGLNRGDFRDDVVDGLAACQSQAGAPSQTSTIADMICDPARPTAWAMSGQASSWRSTRTFKRRLRLIHQGMPHAMVKAAASAGMGLAWGPMAIAAASQPPSVAATVPT